MTLLSRAIAAVRAWLDLNDPSENRLHPSHGWLLPSPADMRAGTPALALALAPVPVPSPSGKRR